MWFDKIEKGLYWGTFASKLKLFVTTDAEKQSKALAYNIKKIKAVPVVFLKNVDDRKMQNWERGVKPISNDIKKEHFVNYTDNNVSNEKDDDGGSIFYEIFVDKSITTISLCTEEQKNQILDVFKEYGVSGYIYKYKNSATKRGSRHLVTMTRFPGGVNLLDYSAH